MTYVGARGSLEILPFGTVKREADEDDQVIYTLADLPRLLVEIKLVKKRAAQYALAAELDDHGLPKSY